MLSSLLMASFVAQASEEGFSKLQIFMQQLIDWGVGAGGRIIGAVIIFVVGRFLISFIKKPGQERPPPKPAPPGAASSPPLGHASSCIL